MKAARLLLLGALAALLIHEGACGSAAKECAGDESCACLPNKACNGTLTCASNRCVDLGSVGRGGATGSGGAPGMGGAIATTGGIAGQSAAGAGGISGAAGGLVRGTGGAGGASPGTGGAAGAVTVAIDPDLVVWYPFDESSGTVATDAARYPGGTRDGALATEGTGTATFSEDRQVGTHALHLVGAGNANGGYVVLPSLQTLAPSAVTFALWIKMDASTTGAGPDAFSFASADDTYMSLTVGGTTGVHFQIRTAGAAIQSINTGTGSLLGTGTWHHLAVTLDDDAPYTGKLYLDGALKVSNPQMTLHPAELGATTRNYLGRFVLSVMAYFSGSLDDFRIYKRALSAQEIAALVALR